MHRILFSFHLPWVKDAINVFSYPFFLSLGILLGTLLAVFCARRYPKVPGRSLIRLAFYTAIGGYLGARLWFILVYAPDDFTPSEWLQVWNGGLAIQGGIIGGLLSVILYCRIKKLPLLQVMDVYAPGVALGNMLARIGCFLNGCCWGRICPADFPLAVRFPSMGSGANHHYSTHKDLLMNALKQAGYDHAIPAPFPVHPVQLYLSGSMLLITVLVAYFSASRIFSPGVTALVFLFLYSLNRFIWEFYRDDTGYIGPFHPGQFTAAAFMLLSAAVLTGLHLYSAHKKKETRL